MDDKQILNSQNVNIFNREKIELNGAVEVVSSTEKEVFAKLEGGCRVQVTGEKLTISKLSPEDKFLCVIGKISGVMFLTAPTKRSFLKKVFK